MKRRHIIAATILILLIIAIGAVVATQRIQEEGDQTSQTVDPGTTRIQTETDIYTIDVRLPPADTLGGTEVRAFLTDYVETFKQQASEDVPTLRERGNTDIRYTLDASGRTHTTDQYISHVVTIGEYTGGASGNQSVETFVFDRSSGQQLQLSDVLPEDQRDAFLAEVKQRLFEVNNIEPGAEGVFADAIRTLTISDIESFYITEEEIAALFSQYEVAPGAAGVILVPVPR